MHRIFVLAGLLAVLSGCGGMNRAVTILPQTMDGIAGRASPARGDAVSAAPRTPRPVQPGDAALAVRP